MIQRGNSINKIRSYLIGKGINNDLIKNTVDKINNENSDQDFQLLRFGKKENWTCQSWGQWPLFYKKDISLLARNGFDFETSKKVMDLDKNDYLKIIRLL